MRTAARSVAFVAASRNRAISEVALLDAPRNQIVRAHDHAQHVIEIVGDAAGELAERFHLLRLPELALDLLAPGDLFDELLVCAIS